MQLGHIICNWNKHDMYWIYIVVCDVRNIGTKARLVITSSIFTFHKSNAQFLSLELVTNALIVGKIINC